MGFITGATASVRKAWEGLGIQTVGELLLTLPRRYDDYSKIVPIREAQAGDVVTIKGSVLKCLKLPSFRKRIQIFRVVVQDQSGSVSMNFFQQPWILTELVPGKEIYVSGKIIVHPKYGKSMAHPLWESADKESIAVGKIAPVYSLTGTLAQKTYRRLIQVALNHLDPPADPLANDHLQRLGLVPLMSALRLIHEPSTGGDAERGRSRLAFDELLTYQLALHIARSESDQAGAPAIPFQEGFAKSFAYKLPFSLTDDQKRSVWVALQDMQRPRPMRRLLQGDVGAGKTVVAAFLAAHTHYSGFSAAILAPTDILAQQHAKTLHRLLGPHHIPLLLITRTTKKLFTKETIEDIKNSELELVLARGNIVLVGTHALLAEHRLPTDLALAVVDEQHRFGVEQREALLVSRRSDGMAPHFLSMTATPIPRSLALTMYGDLDISVLRQKPAGRLPIATTVCVGEERERAYQAMRQAVARKEQVFLVCPIIDPSDFLGVRAVTDEYQRLMQGPLQGLRLGLVHGRLKAVEKDTVMQAFYTGQLDVLIATSMIEVGVDVPQATVMCIESAERFGLAQLHQLRGRVGRSHLASHCFLLTDVQGIALDRLTTVSRIQDGFVLAEEDLKFRGSGNLMGREQSGEATFKAARLSDMQLMVAAQEEAKNTLTTDPALDRHSVWKTRVDHLRQTAHLE